MEMTMPMAPATYGFAGNGGMFGGGDSWFAFLIFALIFGWGGNGGGFGGRGGYNSGFQTGEALASQFDLQDIKNSQRYIDSGIRGLERGLCSSGYDNALQASQTRDVITNSAFGLERGLSNLSTQLADCCCNNQRAIESVKYEMSKGFCDVVTNANLNTRDLLNNQDRNTQRIIDMMTQNELAKLRDEKLALQGQLSQVTQTSTIIDALKPKTAVPAYLVQNPCCIG